MDRLAQTALSAIRQMQDLKFDLANNLANVNVPGFRRDLPNEGNAGFLQTLDEATAKVLPLETDRRLFSSETGRLESTGVDTDVAILNEGFFYIQQTCPTCRGVGKKINSPCLACSGGGRVKKQKTLEVSVPAGIDSGMRIRSAGNGEPGHNGGPSGDLYVEVGVKSHRVFEREDDNLHCEAPLSFAKSALGGNVDVPTLNGKASFQIPEGTQSGKTFRLRGKGMPNVRSGVFGDLYCHVVLETPVNLTEHQRKLLREFEESIDKNKDKHNPHSKSWMDKVKEFFN